jgi:hypothetical protein
MTDLLPDWIPFADDSGRGVRIAVEPLLDQAREEFGIDHALFQATIGSTTYVLVDSAALATVRDLLPLLDVTNPGDFGFDFQSIVRARGKGDDSGRLSLIRRAPKPWPEAARRDSARLAERLMSKLYQMI